MILFQHAGSDPVPAHDSPVVSCGRFLPDDELVLCKPDQFFGIPDPGGVRIFLTEQQQGITAGLALGKVFVAVRRLLVLELSLPVEIPHQGFTHPFEGLFNTIQVFRLVIIFA